MGRFRFMSVVLSALLAAAGTGTLVNFLWGRVVVFVGVLMLGFAFGPAGHNR
jgi:hypothetical protein